MTRGSAAHFVTSQEPTVEPRTPHLRAHRHMRTQGRLNDRNLCRGEQIRDAFPDMVKRG